MVGQQEDVHAACINRRCGDFLFLVNWLTCCEHGSSQLTAVRHGPCHAGKLGHSPQEDFADAFSPTLLDFFAGEDITVKGTKKFRKYDTEDQVIASVQSGNFVE